MVKYLYSHTYFGFLSMILKVLSKNIGDVKLFFW